MKKLDNNSFKFVDEIFIIFSMIVHEKSLNIPDGKEKGFNDYFFFYSLCLLLGENAVYEIITIGKWERRRFIDDIFQSPSRESFFPYFILCEASWNSLLILCDFYTTINLYVIRHYQLL